MNPYCLRFILNGLLILLLASGCERLEPTSPDELLQKDISPPNIVRIFPSSDVLPANHLKFYIEFPLPMARGEIFEHFSLIETESGEPVPEPFREVELWNESGRRLTLWFHPGRQKPGVNLNVEIGPILEEGKNYTLIISGEWQTESGLTLGHDVRKKFRAGPMDNSQPNPDDWKYTIPDAGSKDPLSIIFPGPLDYALIPRTIQVESESNSHIAYTYSDHSIQFTPSTPWQAGSIKISIDPKLEDLAGNSISRPFNLDLESTQKPVSTSKLSRNIEIK